MNLEKKQRMRRHLFYFSIWYLICAFAAGVVLTWFDKDVSAFAGLVGSTAVALAGALAAHFFSKPSE